MCHAFTCLSGNGIVGWSDGIRGCRDFCNQLVRQTDDHLSRRFNRAGLHADLVSAVGLCHGDRTVLNGQRVAAILILKLDGLILIQVVGSVKLSGYADFQNKSLAVFSGRAVTLKKRREGDQKGSCRENGKKKDVAFFNVLNHDKISPDMQRSNGNREVPMRKWKRYPLTLWILAAAMIIAQTGCGAAGHLTAGSGQEERAGSAVQGENPVTKESFYFDTICQITIYGIQTSGQENTESEQSAQKGAVQFSAAAEDIIAEAFSLCSEYEELLSKTKEGSDIWNINHAGGKPVDCDERTIEIIEKGISYGDLSEGKFDITVGKAEDLWNFHSDSPKVPKEEALKEAVSHVDYRKISVDLSGGTVQLLDPEAEIDLGGIAKGYIADQVCEFLRKSGVTSAIVSLGGNIECIGGKPETVGFTTEITDFSPFSIGIETPYSDRTKIVGASPLENGTMVTSGVYERYFTENGKEYHHILDVKTGYPAETDVLGVTIQGAEGTSADCDALSTICLLLGSEQGGRLIDHMDGYEALFILRDDSVQKTTGMEFTHAE